MTNITRRRKIRTLIGILAVLFLVITGCSGLNTRKSGGLTTPAKNKAKSRPASLYYDFSDVLIPSELKLDRKASFVFQTPNITAGVLALKGRVEMGSLIRFFESNMIKDNWEPVSSFKSVRTIMLYKKDNRWCVINISEKSFNTHVEIWVAPTSSESEGGLVK